jgi:hypothetical protein
MSRVFVVTEPITYNNGIPVPLFDISPAREFGEIVVLSEHNQSMAASVPMVRMLREKMKDFGDGDYILPVGDPVVIATVAAIASDLNHGYFQMLKWNKRMRTYEVFKINAYGNKL